MVWAVVIINIAGIKTIRLRLFIPNKASHIW